MPNVVPHHDSKPLRKKSTPAQELFRGPKFMLDWLTDLQSKKECQELWNWLDGDPDAVHEMLAVLASRMEEG